MLLISTYDLCAPIGGKLLGTNRKNISAKSFINILLSRQFIKGFSKHRP